MTTWLKKLRMNLLRRKLKRVTSNMNALNPIRHPYAWIEHCDMQADLIDRIAELEKSL